MSFAGFKKQMNKTSQFLSEKVGGQKGSEIETEFLELGRKIDVVNESVESMQVKTKEYLQPNPNARTKMALQSSYQKVRGHANTSKYPQPEFNLGEVFTKFGGGLNDLSPYAMSLVEFGTTFGRMSEAKDEMEIQVKQNFLDPLYDMQQKDLKEISHHRKKLESRRLDYDYKKNKGDKVTGEELQLAQDKFEDSKDICYTSMANYMESDTEHIKHLHEFAKNIRDYHQQCTNILESLTNSLSEQLNVAASRPRKEIASINRSRLSRDSYVSSNSSDSITISMPVMPSAPMPQKPSCRALYDFEAENEGELAFNEGDMIELTSSIDENWFEGRCNGREGYFPKNFVDVVVPL